MMEFNYRYRTPLWTPASYKPVPRYTARPRIHAIPIRAPSELEQAPTQQIQSAPHPDENQERTLVRRVNSPLIKPSIQSIALHRVEIVNPDNSPLPSVVNSTEEAVPEQLNQIQKRTCPTPDPEPIIITITDTGNTTDDKGLSSKPQKRVYKPKPKKLLKPKTVPIPFRSEDSINTTLENVAEAVEVKGNTITLDPQEPLTVSIPVKTHIAPLKVSFPRKHHKHTQIHKNWCAQYMFWKKNVPRRLHSIAPSMCDRLEATTYFARECDIVLPKSVKDIATWYYVCKLKQPNTRVQIKAKGKRTKSNKTKKTVIDRDWKKSPYCEVTPDDIMASDIVRDHLTPLTRLQMTHREFFSNPDPIKLADRQNRLMLAKEYLSVTRSLQNHDLVKSAEALKAHGTGSFMSTCKASVTDTANNISGSFEAVRNTVSDIAETANDASSFARQLKEVAGTTISNAMSAVKKSFSAFAAAGVMSASAVVCMAFILLASFLIPRFFGKMHWLVKGLLTIVGIVGIGLAVTTALSCFKLAYIILTSNHVKIIYKSPVYVLGIDATGKLWRSVRTGDKPDPGEYRVRDQLFEPFDKGVVMNTLDDTDPISNFMFLETYVRPHDRGDHKKCSQFNTAADGQPCNAHDKFNQMMANPFPVIRMSSWPPVLTQTYMTGACFYGREHDGIYFRPEGPDRYKVLFPINRPAPDLSSVLGLNPPPFNASRFQWDAEFSTTSAPPRTKRRAKMEGAFNLTSTEDLSTDPIELTEVQAERVDHVRMSQARIREALDQLKGDDADPFVSAFATEPEPVVSQTPMFTERVETHGTGVGDDDFVFNDDHWAIATAFSGCPVSTILSFVVCGGMSMVSGFPVAKSLAMMLTAVPRVAAGINEANKIGPWIFKHLPTFMQKFMLSKLGCYEGLDIDPRFKRTLTGCWEVITTFDKDPNRCTGDPKTAEWCVNMYGKLMKYYERHVCRMDRNSPQLMFAKIVYEKMSKYVTACNQTLMVGNFRQVPVGVAFQGPSQIGKTTLAPFLSAALFPDTDECELLYTRTPGRDYWDAYHRQKAVYYDDFMYLDSKYNTGQNPFDDLLSQISSTPLSVNMADCDEKGLMYCSQLVILSMNKGLTGNIQELREPQAIKNRFPCYFKVRVHPHYQKQGNANAVDWDAVKAQNPTPKQMVLLPWLVFDWHRYACAQPKKVNMSFLQVCALCKEYLDKAKADHRTMAEQREEAAKLLKAQVAHGTGGKRTLGNLADIYVQVACYHHKIHPNHAPKRWREDFKSLVSPFLRNHINRKWCNENKYVYYWDIMAQLYINAPDTVALLNGFTDTEDLVGIPRLSSRAPSLAISALKNMKPRFVKNSFERQVDIGTEDKPNLIKPDMINIWNLFGIEIFQPTVQTDPTQVAEPHWQWAPMPSPATSTDTLDSSVDVTTSITPTINGIPTKDFQFTHHRSNSLVTVASDISDQSVENINRSESWSSLTAAGPLQYTPIDVKPTGASDVVELMDNIVKSKFSASMPKLEESRQTTNEIFSAANLPPPYPADEANAPVDRPHPPSYEGGMERPLHELTDSERDAYNEALEEAISVRDAAIVVIRAIIVLIGVFAAIFAVSYLAFGLCEGITHATKKKKPEEEVEETQGTSPTEDHEGHIYHSRHYRARGRTIRQHTRGTAGFDISITDKIATGTYQFLNSDGIRCGTTLPWHSHFFIVPRHFFAHNGVRYIGGEKFTLVRWDGEEYEQVFDPNRLSVLKKKNGDKEIVSELAMYYTTPIVPFFPDCRPFYLHYDHVDSRHERPATMVNTRDADFVLLPWIYRNKEFIESDDKVPLMLYDNWTYVPEDPKDTTYGVCGSSIYSEGKGNACDILTGMVVAYDRVKVTFPDGVAQTIDRGRAELTCKEFCEQLESELKDRNKEYPFPPIDTLPLDIELQPLDYRSKFPKGNTQPIGMLKHGEAVRSLDKTELRKSLIHNAIPELQSQVEPAILSKADPRNPTRIDPMMRGAQKYAHPFKAHNLSRVMACADAIKEDLGEPTYPFRVLTVNEAVGGIDGVDHLDSLNMRTSEGAPWNTDRPKDRDGRGKSWLFEQDASGKYSLDTSTPLYKRLKEKEANMLQGKIDPSLWTDSLKDELRPLDKIYTTLKTRVFIAAPVEYVILWRMYCGYFMKFFIESYHHCYSAVGMNVFSADWDEMIKYLLEVSPRGFDVDYSNWDGGCSPELMEACADVIDRYYQEFDPDYDHSHRLLRFAMVQESIKSFELIHYCVIQSQGGMPSGTPFTSVINSMVNAMQMRLCYLELCPPGFTLESYRDYVREKVFGDDAIIAVNPAVFKWFNPITISEWMKTYNVIMTPADKAGDMKLGLKPIMELNFLKRTTIVNEDLLPGVKYWPYTQPQLLDKMVNWNRSTLPPVEALSVNLEGSLRFLFFNGRGEFTLWRKRFRYYTKRIALDIKMPTYDTLLAVVRQDGGIVEKSILTHIRESEAFTLSMLNDEATDADVISGMKQFVAQRIACHGTSEGNLGQSSAGDEDEPVLTEGTVCLIHPSSIAEGQFGGQEFDLYSFVGRVQLSEVLDWEVGDPFGTVLAKYRMPWDQFKVSITTTPFDRMQWWCGICNVSFQARATNFFQGGCKAVFIPWDADFQTEHPNYIENSANTILAHAGSFLTPVDGATIEQVVPFRHFKGGLDLRDHDDEDFLGTLYLIVYSPLAVGAGGGTKISVNVKFHITDSVFAMPSVTESNFTPPHQNPTATPKLRGRESMVDPQVKHLAPVQMMTRRADGKLVNSAPAFEAHGTGNTAITNRNTYNNNNYENVSQSTLGNMESKDQFKSDATQRIQAETVVPVNVDAANGMAGSTGGQMMKSATGAIDGMITGLSHVGVEAAAKSAGVGKYYDRKTGGGGGGRGQGRQLHVENQDQGPGYRGTGTRFSQNPTRDRPEINTEPFSQIARGLPTLIHANQLDYSIPLSLYCGFTTTVEPKHFGTVLDEMDTDVWTGLEQELGRFTWDTEDESGRRLMSFYMCPCSFLFNGLEGEVYDLSLLDMFTMRHEFWKGSLQVTIVIFATGIHSGTLVVAPHYAHYLPIDDLVVARTQYAQELHLRDGQTVFHFELPFLVNKPRLRVPRGNPDNFADYATGVCSIYVQNVLRASDIVSSSLECCVWMRAGHDYEAQVLSTNNNSCELVWESATVNGANVYTGDTSPWERMGRTKAEFTYGTSGATNQIASNALSKDKVEVGDRRSMHMSHLGHRGTLRYEVTVPESSSDYKAVVPVNEFIFGSKHTEYGNPHPTIFDWISPIFRWFRGDFRIKIFMHLHTLSTLYSEVYRTPNIDDASFSEPIGPRFITPHITNEKAPFHEITIRFESNFHILAIPKATVTDSDQFFHQGYLKHLIKGPHPALTIRAYVLLGEGFRFGVFMAVPRIRLHNGGGSSFGGVTKLLPEFLRFIHSATNRFIPQNFDSIVHRTVISHELPTIDPLNGPFIDSGEYFCITITCNVKQMTRTEITSVFGSNYADGPLSIIQGETAHHIVNMTEHKKWPQIMNWTCHLNTTVTGPTVLQRPLTWINTNNVQATPFDLDREVDPYSVYNKFRTDHSRDANFFADSIVELFIRPLPGQENETTWYNHFDEPSPGVNDTFHWQTGSTDVINNVPV